MRNLTSKNHILIYLSSIIYLCMVVYALPYLNVSFLDHVQLTRSDQEVIYSYTKSIKSGNYSSIPFKFLFMALVLNALASIDSLFLGLEQMQFIFLFKSIVKFTILFRCILFICN